LCATAPETPDLSDSAPNAAKPLCDLTSSLGISYSNKVEKVTGIELEKFHGFSDVSREFFFKI